MPYRDDEREVIAMTEVQAEIDESTLNLALAAAAQGPAACGRTASDLGFALEQAVRVMGVNKTARPKLAIAMAEHTKVLATLAAEWAVESR